MTPTNDLGMVLAIDWLLPPSPPGKLSRFADVNGVLRHYLFASQAIR
jgi:hypothetical protein